MEVVFCRYRPRRRPLAICCPQPSKRDESSASGAIMDGEIAWGPDPQQGRRCENRLGCRRRVFVQLDVANVTAELHKTCGRVSKDSASMQPPETGRSFRENSCSGWPD